MDELARIKKERAELLAQMQAIEGRCEKRGSWTDEEKKALGELLGADDLLKQEVERRELAATAARPASGNEARPGEARLLAPGESLRSLPMRGPGSDARPGELSFARALRGMICGDWRGASEERSIMAEGTGAAGGFLVPAALSRDLLEAARNQAVCIKAGAMTRRMESPEERIVVLGDPTGGWASELAALPETDVATNPVNLKAMACGLTIQVSEELIRDAPNSEAAIQNAASKSVALSLDYAGLMGSGVGEPRGLYYTTGVGSQSCGVNGQAPTYALISAAIHDVLAANGTPTALIWSPRTNHFFDTSLGGDQQPLEPPASVKAIRILTSNQVPNDLVQGSSGAVCSAAFAGDFSGLLFGMLEEFLFAAERTGKTGDFSKRIITLRGYLRADLAVVRPAFFSVLRGITAN